jgi:hypothetical protein
MFDGAGAAWGFDMPSALLHKVTLYWDAMNATWNEWVLGYGPENQDKFMEWLGMDDPDWRKMMLTMIAVVIGIVLLISLILSLRYRPPKRDRAAILYRKFVRKTGIEPETGETPITFAVRLRSESEIPGDSVDEITTAYLAARYGPANPAALQKLQDTMAALPR